MGLPKISTSLPKISIRLPNDETFTATPLILYKIKKQQRNNYVAIYNLILTENKKNTETLIPYYISNGRTNQFRAGMLFPFMCYNLQDSEHCPFTDNLEKIAYGGLLKYQIGTNINVGIITAWIEKHIVENYNKNVYKEWLKKNKQGLPSVLSRIANLLDYFIAIASPHIRFPKDISEYSPVRDYTNKDEFAFTDNLKKINKRKCLGIGNCYRNLLLYILNDHVSKLQGYGYISIEDQTFEPIEKTPDEFNSIIGICTQYTCADILYNQYIDISKKLHCKFRSILDTNASKSSFKGYLFNLLNDGTYNIETLPNHILNWKANCKNKLNELTITKTYNEICDTNKNKQPDSKRPRV